ncbi:alpha/beta hydrolase fold domain-containing protein [Rhodococcoides corynebacterioides]|uniref:alpha/beta hydrolase fold domain-containing protein n=1 Tax=Nocardiaceae TaxID=85025 RepID=UPI00195BB738
MADACGGGVRAGDGEADDGVRGACRAPDAAAEELSDSSDAHGGTARHRAVRGRGTARRRGASARRPCVGGVLYLHGGAFVSEIAAQHWSLVDELTEAGLAVAVPHYGLAPDHTVDDAYPLLRSVHERMVAEHGIDHTAIMGDSAGGTLALGLAQRLAAAGRPGSHLCLIFPWLDLALTNPAIPDVEARDPWLTSVGLRHVARSVPVRSTSTPCFPHPRGRAHGAASSAR